MWNLFVKYSSGVNRFYCRLVSIAVLLGNLTTSLTTDIVFSDIKLYGSKVITRNLVFFSSEIGKNDMSPSVELLCGTFL